MPDAKISELPLATTPLAGTEEQEIVQGGVNKRVAVSHVGGAAGVTSVNGDAGPAVTLDSIDIPNTPAGTIAATTVQAAINELDTEKAPIASPTFTGVPAAPTAGAGTNTTQLATTQFVQTAVSQAKSFVVAVTDEVTNISTGTAKVTFRMPYAMTLTSVRASLTVAQASGTIFTVDINETGTTILSTKLTIDNTETTSVSAATPPVISDTALADDAVITIDVDQIGNGSAIGLKVTFIGT